MKSSYLEHRKYFAAFFCCFPLTLEICTLCSENNLKPVSTSTAISYILQIVKSGILQIKLNNPDEQILPLDHHHCKWRFCLLCFLSPRNLISLPHFSAYQFWYSKEYRGRHLSVFLDQQSNSPTRLAKKAIR